MLKEYDKPAVIGYHGRVGYLRSTDFSSGYVYFPDIDDEEEISLDELVEQGNVLDMVRCNNCMRYGEDETEDFPYIEEIGSRGCPKCRTDSFLMDV
jgi:hypothetical protein